MNWTEIILSIASVILTSLAALGVACLKSWLTTKIKDKKALSIVSGILDVITTSVKVTYQTYVEAIKGTDMWTEAAQKSAMNSALEMAKQTLDSESKEFITNNYGDLDKYLIAKIESTIYDLKK